MISLKRALVEGSTRTSNILVSVDVQPEYEKYISFDLNKYFQFIQQYDVIYWLYNGYDTLAMSREDEVRVWMYEYIGDESVMDSLNIRFYDKGYAYFRYCMDSDIDEDKIVDLVKMMYERDITDSRQLDKKFWKDFIRSHGHRDIKELLEDAQDCIHIPDVMEYLKKSVNQKCDMAGGGLSECLKEVEIAMRALNKPYTILSSWTY